MDAHGPIGMVYWDWMRQPGQFREWSAYGEDLSDIVYDMDAEDEDEAWASAGAG